MRTSTTTTLTWWAGYVLTTVLAIGAPRAQPGAPGAPPPPPPAPGPGPAPAPAPVPGEPAGVCVAIDPARDTLTEQERVAVRGIVLQAFANERLPINSSGSACTETYVVSNIKLGNTINVTISGQRGQRTGRSTSLDDLPNVYAQMVKSLVTGAPMETGGGATDRTNVTKDQSAPRRVAADSLKYVSLGYGGVIAGRFAYGPAFGFGYRKELDRIGLDISALNIVLANDSDLSDGVNMSLIKLLGLFYQNPTADGTVYYGAGLSYGFVAVSDDNRIFTGAGLQGHLVAGYEAFRSSTIRGFVQFDATLPFYKSDDSGEERYTPTVTLQLGFGWGKSNVVRVINE